MFFKEGQTGNKNDVKKNENEKPGEVCMNLIKKEGREHNKLYALRV